MGLTRRLIVVSNRLPVTIDTSEKQPRVNPSGGGLVTALNPILRQRAGVWVGSPGTGESEVIENALREWNGAGELSFAPVFLSEAERNSFYNGFSNEVVWPLFHGFPTRCRFDPAYWAGYTQATQRFASVLQKVAQPRDYIWVHDYHLMKLALCARQRGLQHYQGYFHHIPFPPIDVFEMLPWREDLLSALLNYDRLGFQTTRDCRNFIDCVCSCLPDVRILRMAGETQLLTDNRTVSVGTHPVSIDYDEFARGAADSSIQNSLSGSPVVLGVDRLDYTKGVCERLQAFRTLLDRNENLRGNVTMVQIVIPSREDIPAYAQLKTQIETLISKINGQYTWPGWVPIHYLYRHVSRPELIAFYRAAAVAMVTPLKDGMNLVAKEFCASRTDNRGVLVLSEFAGAAEELRRGALMVNPHDSEAMASRLRAALTMPESEQISRMGALRAHLKVHDVYRWARSFILDRIVEPGIAASIGAAPSPLVAT
jgi:trehalose 6-phosphate synthase